MLLVLLCFGLLSSVLALQQLFWGRSEDVTVDLHVLKDLGVVNVSWFRNLVGRLVLKDRAGQNDLVGVEVHDKADVIHHVSGELGCGLVGCVDFDQLLFGVELVHQLHVLYRLSRQHDRSEGNELWDLVELDEVPVQFHRLWDGFQSGFQGTVNPDGDRLLDGVDFLCGKRLVHLDVLLNGLVLPQQEVDLEPRLVTEQCNLNGVDAKVV